MSQNFARQPAETVAAHHILCPQCRALNRVPADKPAEKAKCGVCHQTLFDGTPVAVDEAGFTDHLARNDIPILADMWAPWCGPCRTMGPIFERLAPVLEPHVRLLKLNVDEAPTTAGRLGIRGIPALFLFQNGRVLAQTAGVQAPEAIVRWVQAHLPAVGRA
jgi:thioredoxin 2